MTDLNDIGPDEIIQNEIDQNETDQNETEMTCPRCATVTRSRFYGPCPACREQLRATIGGQPHQVATADYEPKMNVTPNAVATKD